MGLLHKTKFVPFIDVSTTTTPSWVQIKKSTTFSLAFNPQTKTFDFISSENPEEEIDSYQPALSQSLTMFDDEPDFDLALNERTEGAVTVANGVPTFIAGTWNGDEFTPAA